MKLFKRIRAFLKYHIGPKDVTYPNKLHKYLPKEIMDAQVIVTLGNFNSVYQTYMATVATYIQEYDV